MPSKDETYGKHASEDCLPINLTSVLSRMLFETTPLQFEQTLFISKMLFLHYALFIFFSLFKSSSTSLDICANGTIFLDSTITVISPNYPEFYDDNLDCTLIVRVPKDSKVVFNFNYLRTERTHDTIDIVINSVTYSSDGDTINVPRGVQVVKNSFILTFKSDSNVVYGGFSLTCTLVNLKSNNIISTQNGIIWGNNMSGSYIFLTNSGWTRSVYFIFKTMDKCPKGSYIKVYLDGTKPEDACTDTNDLRWYHGDFVTLDISTAIKPNIESIHYSSFRMRGRVRCNPDFDCGDHTCIPNDLVCDGLFDCEHDVDEDNCENTSLTPYLHDQKNDDSSSTLITLVILFVLSSCLLLAAFFYRNRNYIHQYLLEHQLIPNIVI